MHVEVAIVMKHKFLIYENVCHWRKCTDELGTERKRDPITERPVLSHDKRLRDTIYNVFRSARIKSTRKEYSKILILDIVL
jgi:hypothetical protein